MEKLKEEYLPIAETLKIDENKDEEAEFCKTFSETYYKNKLK